MIRTVADLLDALVKQEATLLERYDLQHGPMIGDMYEGLARNVLDKAIFDGLDLRVVEGKIRNKAGVLSRQIDCMIVEGECEPIPYTAHCLCDVEKVLAIVEVKKNLYSDELDDSLTLMREIMTKVHEPHEMKRALVRDAWVGLMLSELPSREEVEHLSPFEQTMFHVLMVAANLPLRVVFGYRGFTTEHGMRKGFAEHLKGEVDNKPKGSALGPLAMPNQIICGDHSIIKLDGMPFSVPVDGDEWACLATSGRNSIHFFLELLWTRLSYRYGLSSDIFGEDLEIEQLNRFMDVSGVLGEGDIVGWSFDYKALSKATLAQPAENAEWEPETLTEAQFVIVNELCKKEGIDLNEPSLATFLQEKGTSVDEVVADLRAKRLAHARSGTLRLLTKECQCLILPDGRYVAGENNSGRLERWFGNYMEARRSGSQA